MAFKLIQSLRGKLGLTNQGHIAYKELNVTQPAVAATITVAAATTSPRAITIQLKDVYGNDIDYSETVEVCAFADQARSALAATGGSTGLGGAGLTPVVLNEKRVFLGTTSATGALSLTHTDTGTAAVAIGVKLPNGRWVMGDRVATIGT